MNTTKDQPQRLSAEQQDEFLNTLQARFEEHPERHPELSWEKVQDRLENRLVGASLFRGIFTGKACQLP